MNVPVDQTRQQRQATEIEHRLVAWPTIGDDLGDAPVVDDDREVTDRRRRAGSWAPPHSSMPSRATTISPLKYGRAASIHICSVTTGWSAGTRCESTSVLTPAAAATRPTSST